VNSRRPIASAPTLRPRRTLFNLADRPSEVPPWTFLILASAVFGVLLMPLAFASPSLYLYAFPLFGIGVTYVLQFRREFARPWKVALVATSIVSIVALALDWPFSGHILWNVLFIGHARRFGRRRTAWMAVLAASLVHLFALKIAFQTGRDIVGGVISIAVASAALAVLVLTTRPARLT